MQHDAVLILQRRNLSAAHEGNPGACRTVSAGDARRIMNVGGGADQVRGGDAKGAETESAHAQPKSSAVTDQGAGSPAGADNKTGLHNMQPDGSGSLCLRRRGGRQTNRRKRCIGRHKFDQLNRPEHCHPPVSLDLSDVFAQIFAQVRQMTHLHGAILWQTTLI